MNLTPSLAKLRNHLFYGSSSYTKNQPDLFVPHHFQMLSARSVTSFIETIKQSMDETEILLYCHLPFCVSECLFCNSFPMKAEAKAQQGYLQHLLKEIDLFAQSGIFEGKKAKCIYFGGGTPTSYPNSDLDLIIATIRSSIELSPNCSITSEAHPLTLRSESRIEGLASIGINRISIGCQSFDANVLSHCNRDNAEPLIRQIVKTAQTCGLAINIDMMTGLPGQTISSVRRDLDILSDIHPNAVEYIRHEIVNPLVAELYRQRPDLMVNDDTLFEMVHISQEWMDKRGYEQNGRFQLFSFWRRGRKEAGA
jgi:oxygen-independent coproporphyrinogen-3 oxidase